MWEGHWLLSSLMEGGGYSPKGNLVRSVLFLTLDPGRTASGSLADLTRTPLSVLLGVSLDFRLSV